MPDHLRRLRRVVVAVGLSASVFISAAQDGSTTATSALDGIQVLQCRVAASLPTPPAEAHEGGFGFMYESLGGTALDGRACTVYRLRNLAGSPPTPVRWSAGSELLVDVARLGRCADDVACDWIEVARYFDGDFVDGDTRVSYGLNADSFHVDTPGLVAFTAPNVAADSASVGTEVVGTVLTSEGEEVVLDLVVKSRIERHGDDVTFVYEAEAEDPTQLDASHFVLEWEVFDLLPDDSVAVGDVSDLFRSPGTGLPVAGSSADPTNVNVRVRSGVASYRDLLVLTVRAAGDEGEVLLRVPLPAFLPLH